MALCDNMTESFFYEKNVPPRNTTGTQHYHKLFEIYYLEEGICSYFIDNETYEVETGDIVLIPSGIIHKTIYGDGAAMRRLIYCSSLFIPTSVAPHIASMLYVYRNGKLKEEILKIFNSIEKEYLFPDEFSENIIQHYMHMLFFLLARNDTELARKSTNTYTTKAIDFIKKNYFESISLSDVSAACAISPEHLSRIFKRDTGLGFSEYLTTLRLQNAAELLLSDKKLSILKIAEMCGFSDSNYFSKRFKETYGVSPLRFRKG